MTTAAERIRLRRVELKMSQMTLAIAVNTNPTQISRYERGENDPSGTVLVALARALKTSTDYLLGLVDDPAPRFNSEEIPSPQG